MKNYCPMCGNALTNEACGEIHKRWRKEFFAAKKAKRVFKRKAGKPTAGDSARPGKGRGR